MGVDKVVVEQGMLWGVPGDLLADEEVSEMSEEEAAGAVEAQEVRH